MIYLNNSTATQVVYVPATSIKVDGTLTFTLKNTIDNNEPISVSVTSTNESDIYYKFNLSLTAKIQEGEYEYELKKGTTDLEQGLAIVGDSSQKKEYNNIISYEQYESE
jgi:hypothetical protein